MDFFSSPAWATLVAALVATFVSTSIGSLLFFWRYKAGYVAMGTTLILVVIYGLLIISAAASNSPLTFMQPWPATGWSKLEASLSGLAAGSAGLVLGILFMAIARVAELFDRPEQPDPPGGTAEPKTKTKAIPMPEGKVPEKAKADGKSRPKGTR
jgi:hypothetical protein